MEEETLHLLSSPIWDSVLADSTETCESKNNEKTVNNACGRNTHRVYNVQSMGWLPIDYKNLHSSHRSSAVNSCIRALVGGKSQIMDVAGVWGEGMNLSLELTDDHLKIKDKFTEKVLQMDPIKNIKIWGVGRDSKYEFAYVMKDPKSKMYKCQVFDCETSAETIAKELHKIWDISHDKHKQRELLYKEPEEMLSHTDTPLQTFSVQYLGKCEVSDISGIDVLRSGIKKVQSLQTQTDVNVCVSTAEVSVKHQTSDEQMFSCRLRYLSFIGVGDDIRLFAFISVLHNNGPLCYVFFCPNNSHLPLAVREACLLRFQTILDSKSKTI